MNRIRQFQTQLGNLVYIASLPNFQPVITRRRSHATRTLKEKLQLEKSLKNIKDSVTKLLGRTVA